MSGQRGPGAQIGAGTLTNLRDLGGWPVAGGGRVRRGLLYRSADLDRLEGAGQAALAGLGLRTVIDLRTAGERQARPDRLPAGVETVVCDVLADSAGAAPAQLHAVLADPAVAARLLGDGRAEALFAQGYRDIVSSPSALAAWRRFLSMLAESGRRPMLFHCTTGKDRTGWGAALVLSLLGVSRADVMRDYLLSNDQLLPSLAPVLARFRAAGGDPALLEPALGVRPAYLAAAFDEVDRAYGGLATYLTEGLGIEPATLADLRRALVEPA